MQNYYDIIGSLDTMNDLEKKNKSKKDYANIINCMLCDLSYRIILKNCIKEKLKKLTKTSSKRIKKKNKKVYLTTLGDYLSYINNL